MNYKTELVIMFVMPFVGMFIGLGSLGFIIPVIVIGVTLLGGLAGKHLLSSIYIRLHKTLNGKDTIYQIDQKPVPANHKNPKRVIVPTLFAISVTLMFTNNETMYTTVWTFITTLIPSMPSDIVTTKIYSLLFGGSVASGIAMFLLTPGWLLLDSGLVYSNQKKVQNTKEPMEIRSVADTYLSFLKGYASIGGLYSLLLFSIDLYTLRLIEGFDLLRYVEFFIIPLLVLIYSFPAVAILDRNVSKNEQFILKIAAIHGITEKLIIPSIQPNN